jgi:hypothetical protein
LESKAINKDDWKAKQVSKTIGKQRQFERQRQLESKGECINNVTAWLIKCIDMGVIINWTEHQNSCGCHNL